MRDELLEKMPKVTLAEDHKVIETLGAHGLHETLRVGVTVRALGRNGHAGQAARLQKSRPGLGEQRVAIMDEMRRLAEEANVGIEEVPRRLHHPSAVGIDSGPCDIHRA